MYPDYHMHTTLSDGCETHSQMLAAAQGRGVSEIGFSDHISVKPVGWSMPLSSIPLMVEAVELLKGQSGAVAVKFGAEVDYVVGKEAQIAELLKQIPLDYCIGSVHFINDWNFDTDSSAFKGIDVDAFYREYFSMVQRSAKSGLYDIIGHCDLAKKFDYYPSFTLDRLYEETARVFSDYGVVFELNTSGRNKPCSEFYPSVGFIQMLHHYKVPVTLGSDAHKGSSIGQFFPEAVALLKRVGYSELALFSNRSRFWLNL